MPPCRFSRSMKHSGLNRFENWPPKMTSWLSIPEGEKTESKREYTVTEHEVNIIDLVYKSGLCLDIRHTATGLHRC
jgi:hypothetical protein